MRIQRQLRAWLLFLLLSFAAAPWQHAPAKTEAPAVAALDSIGIDHTAIVVSDTEASLRFYRDTLGLKQAGESENYGVEQEHLNNVFGARLRITALRAGSGPGVEFLEYLAPRDGRPYPGDARAGDLFNWQTNFISTDVHDAEGRLRAGKFAFISPGAVDFSDVKAAFHTGLSVRDPDGRFHGVPEVEKESDSS